MSRMVKDSRKTTTVELPPWLGSLVTEITEIPDIDMALRRVISEYLELKEQSLQSHIADLELKWGMTFQEFSKRCAEDTLGKDVYAYEVEKDFWEWERAVTLQRHYESLGQQWM